MLNDNEGPRDWEIKDEEPSEQLKKKWEQEETRGPQTAVCPSCKKETPAENLACIFCGVAILQENCPISCFLTWIKRLFKKD
ncbi:MAG: hypothetical protein WC331_07610 [Candidatus Omnitrophota bacterium]